MIESFLVPVDRALFFNPDELTPYQWGNYFTFNDGDLGDLNDYHLAIFGVLEDRADKTNKGCAEAADEVRKHLYQLYNNEHPLKIIDLGNVKPGKTVKDTYVAVQEIIAELLRHKVIPLIIGGSHDLTYAQYKGYEPFNQLINTVVIDETIDLQISEDQSINASSFLMQIFAQEPTYLFTHSQLGYQTYLTDYKKGEILKTLNFDCVRLGDLRSDMTRVEPLIRNADLLSFDVKSIQQAHGPAHAKATPNGFDCLEVCQIARYAGFSDKCTSFGIYGLNPLFDNNQQTAQLVAQMIWHFVDGVYNRKGDTPEAIKEHCLKYTVVMESVGHQITFWKSQQTDRWWMELPYGSMDERHLRHKLIPCSYAEYQSACKEILPERWMSAYQRLSIEETDEEG